jgi:hypothetical protein
MIGEALQYRESPNRIKVAMGKRSSIAEGLDVWNACSILERANSTSRGTPG